MFKKIALIAVLATCTFLGGRQVFCGGKPDISTKQTLTASKPPTNSASSKLVQAPKSTPAIGATSSPYDAPSSRSEVTKNQVLSSEAATSKTRYYDPTFRPAVGEHYVNGYYRSNGTYVSGHYRTNPDKSFWNNYSSRGNVNPHTGKVGTKRPK
jgi:hypothetical protein